MPESMQAAPVRGESPKASWFAALVARMARGEQNALAALYDETSPRINGLLLRMLEHPEDAEEALLDVYMKAWKNAGSYSADRGSVQAWLAIMARSIALDRIRHKRSLPKMSGFEFENGFEFVSAGATPEESVGEAQQRRRLQTVLMELPPEQKQVLELAFFRGYTHSELAKRLGQPLGTVKSRIRMAMLKLRDLLEDEGVLD